MARPLGASSPMRRVLFVLRWIEAIRPNFFTKPQQACLLVGIYLLRGEGPQVRCSGAKCRRCWWSCHCIPLNLGRETLSYGGHSFLARHPSPATRGCRVLA